MCGSLVVGSVDGPAVSGQIDAPASGVDHRLDADDHSFDKPRPVARTSVIRNARLLVHRLAESVSFKFTDHRETISLNIRLHRVSYVTDSVPGHSSFDTLVEGSLCDIEEFPGLGRHFPDGVSVSRITVISFVQRSNVSSEYVALPEDLVRRKTVDDDIIHRSADRCGKTLIPKETWNRSVVTDKGLGHLIQLRSCHTRGDPLPDLCQCPGNQDGVLAQKLDFFLCLRSYHRHSIIKKLHA